MAFSMSLRGSAAVKPDVVKEFRTPGILASGENGTRRSHWRRSGKTSWFAVRRCKREILRRDGKKR
jgi:hypothetical protein